jgi:hypothetical protein
MDANWQAAISDMIIVLDCLVLGLWFSANLHRRAFLAISVTFFAMAVVWIGITLIDTTLALGLDVGDQWFLPSRAWRALPARYSFAIGLGVIAAVMRFGRFNGRK